MRRNLSFAALCAVLLMAGCMLFDSGPTTLADGTKVPGKKGVITQVAEGATAAGAVGVPFAGLIGTALGLIGGIGAHVKSKQNRRNLAGMVELVDKIKPQLKELANDEELEALIMKATAGTKFGDALRKMHSSMRKI